MGMWYEYFSGDSLMVIDVGQFVDLLLGEYCLYIDICLNELLGGYIFFVWEVLMEVFELKVFFNLIMDCFMVSF